MKDRFNQFLSALKPLQHGWPFLIIAASFGSVFYTLRWLSPDLGPAKDLGTFGDAFGVLNCLFSGLAFAAVVFTIQKQAREKKAEADHQRSLFNLTASTQAYEQSIELLRDGNNDRVTWIHAGRVLKHAKALAGEVTVNEHKRVLEYKRLEYRTFFRELLEDKSPQFFYGADDRISLFQAAQISHSGASRIGGRLRELSISSIYAIWEAAQWPKSYIDPLEETFTDNEIRIVGFQAKGLKTFLEHRNEQPLSVAEFP